MKQTKNAFVDSLAWLVKVWCLAMVLIAAAVAVWFIQSEVSYGFAAPAFAITFVAIVYSLRAFKTGELRLLGS